MNTLTQEELDKLKNLQEGITHPVGSEDGLFPYMIVGGYCIMWDKDNSESVKDRDYTVSLRNLAPSLIAAAEEGLNLRQQLEAEAVYQSGLRDERDALRARVRELEDALIAVKHNLQWFSDIRGGEGALSPSMESIEKALSSSTPQPPRYTLEWLDIATAPRDGTAILALFPDSDCPHVIRWTDADGMAYSPCWIVVWDGEHLGKFDTPTHWQPLPPAPQQKEGA